MEDKIKLSFSEVSQAIYKYPFPKIGLVIGIGRGGIVPASMIAHQISVNLLTVAINFRDDYNQPRYNVPRFLEDFNPENIYGKVLIVDDVSVTGKTLSLVKSSLAGFEMETFVLKGKADHVLFPEINTCVDWPWKIINYEGIENG